MHFSSDDPERFAVKHEAAVVYAHDMTAGAHGGRFGKAGGACQCEGKAGYCMQQPSRQGEGYHGDSKTHEWDYQEARMPADSVLPLISAYDGRFR